MENARLSAWKGLTILSLLVLPVLLSSCEDPGSVGSSFTQNDGEVSIDTVQVEGIESEQLNSYSGQLPFLSPGRFDDPLFGEVEIISLLRPSIASATSEDEMEEDANMKLRLFVNNDLTYGDSTASATYDLFELDQTWRGGEWKLSDEPTIMENAQVGSFSVDEEDSIDVTLEGDWVDEYREFFNSEETDKDSLYRAQFPGLAVVPSNAAKLSPIDMDSSRVIIENEEDTLEYTFRDGANSLTRENEADVPGDTRTVHNTLEEVLSFEMDLTEENIGSLDVSRVELVFYEDNETLSNTISEVSGPAQRTPYDAASLFLAEPGDLPSAVDPGDPLGDEAEYRESDHSFRFNITEIVKQNMVDGIPEDQQFYLRLQSNDGTLRSSLFHTEDAPEGKKPILIVTSVKNENSSN